MLTVEDIESACNSGQALEFSRHAIDTPELLLRQTFYPLGFTAEIRTNSAEVLALARKLWGRFEKNSDTETIQIDVCVTEGDSAECPPAPTYRLMKPWLTVVADADNFFVSDLARNKTRMTITRATERQKLYLRYFFLEAIVGCHISWRYATPVHAGCVSLDGRGVLLLGDSGAGKSSLTFACARAGWTYVTDDASFLLKRGRGRLVTGNCHQVRLRPTAADLFPEIRGLEVTPRAAGKPSIEIPMAPMRHITCAQTAHVDFLIFLNRRAAGPPQLVPYRKEVARYFIRQLLFGSAESLVHQYKAIDRLLTAEILELRYTDLDWAVEKLRALVRNERQPQQSNDCEMTAV